MSDPKLSLATEAAKAGTYPQAVNKREAKLLEAVKLYVDNSAPNNVITTEGDLIVGDASGDAERLALGATGLPLTSNGTTAAYAALAAAGLAASAVTLAKLHSGIAPSHVTKFAGTFTTLGGDAAESISVPGALATDIVMVSVQVAGAVPRSIVAAAAGTDAIAVTLSGDPSTDHELQYIVQRAAV